MKRTGLVALFAGIVSLGFSAAPAVSNAGVNVNIGFYPPPFVIPAPPPMFMPPAPPAVVVIPGTEVYYSPNVEEDIYFYRGNWYRPYAGRWYRARGYNGPWVYLVPGRVPRMLVSMPPDYYAPPRYYSPYRHDNRRREWRRHYDDDRDD
ncbi:MAG: hypothetical protein HZB61_11630 [Nitrospirae bacterium]|nr:hypothetical protein [Nitrospirota bacterium]